MKISQWVSLVRDTAQAQELPKEDAERDITRTDHLCSREAGLAHLSSRTDSLLVLLANSPFPAPLLAQYIQTALGSAALARPGYVASIIASRVPALALPAAEVAFSAINQALASAPSQPSYPSDTPAETAQAVELVLNSLLPLVLSSPTSALETIRYLSYFLSHLPHRLTKDTVDAEQLEICAKTVRTAVEAVSKVGPKDAPVLAKLRHELEALERKLKPRGRRRVPSKVDLDEADELEALGTPYGDVALLVSRMVRHVLPLPRRRKLTRSFLQLSNPLIPTQQLHSSLLALIRYRTAQSTFRKSTPEKALVHLLAEVLGGLIQTLQDAKRADVVLESLLFAKVGSCLLLRDEHAERLFGRSHTCSRAYRPWTGWTSYPRRWRTLSAWCRGG